MALPINLQARIWCLSNDFYYDCYVGSEHIFRGGFLQGLSVPEIIVSGKMDMGSEWSPLYCVSYLSDTSHICHISRGAYGQRILCVAERHLWSDVDSSDDQSVFARIKIDSHIIAKAQTRGVANHL